MSGDNSSLASALRVLPDRLPAGRPTLNDILSALGDRGLGLVLLIFRSQPLFRHQAFQLA